MNVAEGYMATSSAVKILRVSATTLRTWADEGKIEYYRVGERTKRWYNVKKFLDRCASDEENGKDEQKEHRVRLIYARISTRNQKDDLQRQISYLRTRYPNHELITDIGSGLNFKRKGLKTILDYAIKGSLEELVVAHKDRLCRFGFELFEYLISTYSKGKIVILNNTKSSPEQEVCQDILSILTVFGARVNGLRKYKSQIKEEWKDQKTEESENNKDQTTSDN